MIRLQGSKSPLDRSLEGTQARCMQTNNIKKQYLRTRSSSDHVPRAKSVEPGCLLGTEVAVVQFSPKKCRDKLNDIVLQSFD